MSIASSKGKVSYVEALTLTEDIEPPAVGFGKPLEFKGSVSSYCGAIIKQNNTIIQLLVSLHEKVESIEERLRKVEKKELSLTTDLTNDLVSKISQIRLGDKPIPKKGVLLVDKDPLVIIREEQEKLKLRKQ
uniref:ORF2 n=1 Tax=Dioscorea bacilliform AL virus 2 TaxID=2448908 RepID=A0A4Y1PJ19_9VIRU|nr:ORF2 [Dioscorea bacilliform AL virus 2]